MKKRMAFILFLIVNIGLLSFTFLAKSGKAGYTGSPGENTCNNCHNSYPLNSGTGSINIRTNMPNDQYEPDSTYQISVVVAKPGTSLFGFGLEALNTGNSNTGTFIVTDGLRTQQLTASNGRKNMTHKLNGGAFADSAIFTFNWKAPTTNVGNITFYFTGVCANGNNANSLDYVYKNSLMISSTSAASIDESKEPYADLEVRPFPLGQFVDVQFELEERADIQFKLITLDGKIVQHTLYENQDPGSRSYTIYTSGLNAGIYILNARINEVSVSRKFFLMQ